MSESIPNPSRSSWMLLVPAIGVLVVAGLMASLAHWGGGETASTEETKLTTLTNSLGMRLVLVPGGRFTMGGDSSDQLPRHEVVVAPFYIAAHEVTQAQWQAVMGYNPSQFPDARRPVDQVTWLEAQSFLEKLNLIEGTNKYRLPSEAEWEYAARAGTGSRFFFGDDPGDLRSYAWFGAESNAGTRPVGSLAPNPWGLHDIYGNVWEWVQECWHPDYNGAPADSRVWGGGDCSQRTVRGGAWNNRPERLGSAQRGAYVPNFGDVSNGLRVVMNP